MKSSIYMSKLLIKHISSFSIYILFIGIYLVFSRSVPKLSSVTAQFSFIDSYCISHFLLVWLPDACLSMSKPDKLCWLGITVILWYSAYIYCLQGLNTYAELYFINTLSEIRVVQIDQIGS